MCVSPRIAWQKLSGGELVFSDHQPFDVARKYILPCGKCIECRRAQANEWAIRCLCEASLHKKNCVLTLTYNDENVPSQLVKKDYQNFLKSLRQEVGQLRYFLSGEYGEKSGRPHFHAVIFGWCPEDAVFFKKDGKRCFYRSPLIERLWDKGYSLVDIEMTLDAVKYSANYMQKLEEVYGDLQKPFCAMSLKPGIGYGAITRKMFEDGKIWHNGIWYPIPRYFYKVVLREHRFDDVLKDYRDRKRAIAEIVSVDRTWDDEKRRRLKQQKLFEKKLIKRY